jgi:hypothetical protein
VADESGREHTISRSERILGEQTWILGWEGSQRPEREGGEEKENERSEVTEAGEGGDREV